MNDETLPRADAMSATPDNPTDDSPENQRHPSETKEDNAGETAAAAAAVPAASSPELPGDDSDEGEVSKPPSFEDMNLSPQVLQALTDMGYQEPMEVQVAIFEHVKNGTDLMVQSRTGSGKTAGFGIPIAEMLPADTPGAQALILAPTRELALQVANELQRITEHKSLRVVPIYGGAPMRPQIRALEEGAQIIAGTPGRVLDHIRRKTLKTAAIKLLVLDEADEMLSMGFLEEIDAIIQTLPPKEERQTLLFSATIPEEIQRIASRHMREPEHISLSSDHIGVEEIDHFYYLVSGMARTRDLLKVIKAEAPDSAIIFCNTREDTNTVAKFLTKHGYTARAISSDLSQRDRERVMGQARERKIQFLVATDIAARGIDISDLSHVINYQFPESPEVYVHRTGRTGRAGKTGTALSLVGPREIGAFYYLKLIYKIRPKERDLPSQEELASMQEGEQYERVLQLVPEEPGESYVSLARRLWQSMEGERVVGALLQRLMTQKQPSARRTEHERDERDGREPEVEEEYKRERRGRDRSDRRERRKRGGGREEREEREERVQDKGEQDKGEQEERARRDETSDDGGESKKRRRRRRRRRRGEGGESEDRRPRSLPATGPDGEPKEFWEAWADEKEATDSGVRQDSSEEESSREDDGSARLYVNIGKREKVSADDVRSLLAEGLEDEDASQIGSVSIRNTHCYVRVPEELVDRVIEACEGKSFQERDVVVERAKK